jgi:predicted nucleic-acid-binding Zn-ribbon protein
MILVKCRNCQSEHLYQIGEVYSETNCPECGSLAFGLRKKLFVSEEQTRVFDIEIVRPQRTEKTEFEDFKDEDLKKFSYSPYAQKELYYRHHIIKRKLRKPSGLF